MTFFIQPVCKHSPCIPRYTCAASQTCVPAPVRREGISIQRIMMLWFPRSFLDGVVLFWLRYLIWNAKRNCVGMFRYAKLSTVHEGLQFTIREPRVGEQIFLVTACSRGLPLRLLSDTKQNNRAPKTLTKRPPLGYLNSMRDDLAWTPKVCKMMVL